MRLDKFLKLSRIIKRRPMAKKIAEDGRIKVNGQVAKPSVNVDVGDEIELLFAQKVLTVKVQLLKDHVKKDESYQLYTIVSEESRQEK